MLNTTRTEPQGRQCGWTAWVVAMTSALAGVCAAQGTLPPEPHVSLKEIRQPLRTVCQHLSDQGHAQLSPVADLLEQKAVVIVKDRPLSEVMDRIARVFGAQWTKVANSPDTGASAYRLERRPEVQAWLAYWKESRSAASRYAREQQRKLIRSGWGEVLDHVNDPQPPNTGGSLDLGLARFLRSLPSTVLDRVTTYASDNAAVRPSGSFRVGTPPVEMPFRQLSGPQQQLLRDWLGTQMSRPDDYVVQLLAELPRSRIAITSSDGVSLDVALQIPGRDSPAIFGAFGFAYSRAKLAQCNDEEMFRRMSSRDTPKEAMLGAKISAGGQANPRLEIRDAVTAERKFQMPKTPPRSWEFWEHLSQTVDVNAVTDYYTSSSRLTASARSVEEALQLAAATYDAVVRLDGGYVLARCRTWPDEDECELRAPTPEDWIARKEAQQFLKVDEIASLALLNDDQLDALARYVDSYARISFQNELHSVRSNPENRKVMAAYASLPEATRKKARSPLGIALADLPVAMRNTLVQRAPGRLRGLLARGILRMVANSPQNGAPPVAYFTLFVLNSQGGQVPVTSVVTLISATL